MLRGRYKQSGVGRENHKMMLDHYQQTKNMLVSYSPKKLGFFQADHGPVLFHQSGGCCDGSSPMCYPVSDFIIGGTPVYISGSQYEVWKHTDLIIDAVPGRGGIFSPDNGREVRFLTRSTVCTIPQG